MRTHPLPPPGLTCVMQDLKLLSFNDSGYEIWVLCFRVLGASFSRFGCFVLRFSFTSASFSKLPSQLGFSPTSPGRGGIGRSQNPGLTRRDRVCSIQAYYTVT